MDQKEEKQQEPAPIEPGHVMSREKFRQLVESMPQQMPQK